MFGKLPENKKQLVYRHLHAIGIFCANKIASRFSELVGGSPLPSPSPIGKLHKVYRNSRSIAGMISHAYYTRRFTEIVGEYNNDRIALLSSMRSLPCLSAYLMPGFSISSFTSLNFTHPL